MGFWYYYYYSTSVLFNSKCTVLVLMGYASLGYVVELGQLAVLSSLYLQPSNGLGGPCSSAD